MWQLDTSQNAQFPFVGSVLALDLVNTDILLRGKRHDFIISPDEAEHWWREVNLHYSTRTQVIGEAETTRWNTKLLNALKRLRLALRGLFLCLIEQRSIDAHDLAELNHVLALGYHALNVDASDTLMAVYETTEPESGAVLLPIALSALHLITDMERDRLHECGNERCIGLFYDTTRSATRHWCSAECMNRARSLQHYRKLKAEKAIST